MSGKTCTPVNDTASRYPRARHALARLPALIPLLLCTPVLWSETAQLKLKSRYIDLKSKYDNSMKKKDERDTKLATFQDCLQNLQSKLTQESLKVKQLTEKLTLYTCQPEEV